MFNINLLNRPGKQMKSMDNRLITPMVELDRSSEKPKYQNNKIQNKEKGSSSKFKVLIILVLAIFAIGYYYLRAL